MQTPKSFFREHLTWLFSRFGLYWRWLMTFALPFSLFAAIYVGSGVAVKQAMDAETPPQRIAFVANAAAEQWKEALKGNESFKIQPDVAAANWQEALKSPKDSLTYIVGLETEADGAVSTLQIW